MSTSLARRIGRLEASQGFAPIVVLVRHFVGTVVGVEGPDGPRIERETDEPLADLHRRAFNAAARLQRPFTVLTERTV